MEEGFKNPIAWTQPATQQGAPRKPKAQRDKQTPLGAKNYGSHGVELDWVCRQGDRSRFNSSLGGGELARQRGVVCGIGANRRFRTAPANSAKTSVNSPDPITSSSSRKVTDAHHVVFYTSQATSTRAGFQRPYLEPISSPILCMF
ncbi:hypothetical protein E4U54_001531 [Claviceps lovelessii]|nr:hypothetical protein E4U54_001531 [Claviceps lovelessii]